MSNTSSAHLLAASAALLALAGCVTSPRQLPEVAAARALISQAEQSDASQFASADLESARSKLRQADQDAYDNQPVMAAHRAQESSADAEVAMARTRAIKAEQALAEVNAGTQTLHNETRRQDPPTSSVIVAPADSTTVGQPVQR
ncbi:MAG TPA: DUF4398 domain-containing protein [Steroidobacteraceae bacterium]|jgi:hypothetical protein|nr:DUF4398 domain-containing protein [Steroidobacteraceae bacterium]